MPCPVVKWGRAGPGGAAAPRPVRGRARAPGRSLRRAPEGAARSALPRPPAARPAPALGKGPFGGLWLCKTAPRVSLACKDRSEQEKVFKTISFFPLSCLVTCGNLQRQLSTLKPQEGCLSPNDIFYLLYFMIHLFSSHFYRFPL